jgi:hypothetical protein
MTQDIDEISFWYGTYPRLTIPGLTVLRYVPVPVMVPVKLGEWQ